MATPGDGAGLVAVLGAESSTLDMVEDIETPRGVRRNYTSFDTEDEDDELRPSLDIPLFAVEKVLAVRPRSKDMGDTRRSSTTSSPLRGGSARASNDTNFMSGIFAGDDDVSGASGKAQRQREAREGRREFLAATCTSDASARPGDPPATRVFHAAAHASEEGTRHHLLLRSERVDADQAPSMRALPWYEGAEARIKSLEFSPCSGDTSTSSNQMLLCGTEGGACTSFRRAHCSASPRQMRNLRLTHRPALSTSPRFASCAPQARASRPCCGGDDVVRIQELVYQMTPS